MDAHVPELLLDSELDLDPPCHEEAFKHIFVPNLRSSESFSLTLSQPFQPRKSMSPFFLLTGDDEAAFCSLADQFAGSGGCLNSDDFGINPSWPYQIAAPTDSDRTSSYSSSGLSGSQSPPWISPRMSSFRYPSGRCADGGLYSYSAFNPFDHGTYDGDDSCIAPYDIYNADDHQLDPVPDGEETFRQMHTPYATEAQEGYEPIPREEGTQVCTTRAANMTGTKKPCVERAQAPPNLRHRRTQSAESRPSTHKPRVTKRSLESKTSVPSRLKLSHQGADPSRSFQCPFTIYGCHSSFKSKNEWKRHVNTQHMRLGYWHCSLCEQHDRPPNDFNRKDLFIQHVRRMHPAPTPSAPSGSKPALEGRNSLEEQALYATADRCYQALRTPPEKSRCLFCDDRFIGSQTWDERMEHIGRHMEAMRKREEEQLDSTDWHNDYDVEKWLIREGLVVSGENGLLLASLRD